MEDQRQTIENEHFLLERRHSKRDNLWRRMLDLHYGLQRDHTSLGKQVDTLTIGFQNLSDNQKDNHELQMSVLTRIERTIESKNLKTSIVKACAAFALIIVLGYLLAKVWAI